MAMAVMGASLPREFPGDHEMLMSPRKEQSSNENVAEEPVKMPFKSNPGLETNFTPSTISIPSSSQQFAANQAALSSPELLPGHAISMIPVSLGGTSKPPHHRQSLFSTTPLCMRTFGDGSGTEVGKLLGWGSATPKQNSKDKVDDLQGQQSEGASIFDGTPGEAAQIVSPTDAFMSALSHLPIEESLQYLIQSDPQPPPKSILDKARKAATEGQGEYPLLSALPKPHVSAGPPSLAEFAPISISAQPPACKYTTNQQEYMYHISLALSRLSPLEMRRLMDLLGVPSHQGCLDCLSNVCEPVLVSEDTDADANMPYLSQGGKHGPVTGDIPPLRLDALGPGGPHPLGAPHVHNSFGSDGTFSTRPSTLSTTHFSSMHPSPRLARSSTLTPRGPDESGTPRVAVQSGAVTDRTAFRPRKKRDYSMKYGSALLDKMQEEQRAARKSTCAAPSALSADVLTARLLSPRRRKSGPPSSRDRVWDLLRADEKCQILRDEMSAAEGTKLLLERRAAQLCCAIKDMPDDDDWNIGFRLTECKATSEPLPVPKTCSICLRQGMVFHRHSYYCRRCAQLYRAIHRKKATIQAEQAQV